MYVIAVDFDGTLCENKYPDIGKPKFKIINYIKKRKEEGCKIILYTCRCDNDLINALNWCYKQGLTFDAVNDNISEYITRFDNNSRKINADLYIDDRAMNVNDLEKMF